MSGESIQKIFEEEREEDDEGWIYRFDNSKIYDEERETTIMMSLVTRRINGRR
jgi:hypothetical protein